MSTPGTPLSTIVWKLPDGSTIDVSGVYTPPPAASGPTGPSGPSGPTGAPTGPTGAPAGPQLPAAIASRMNPTPIFDEQFLTLPTWGKTWANSWFGGQKFNAQQLDPSLITLNPGGGISLGVSNGGKTGCMINTNPNNPNSPGFQIGYGYVEFDVECPNNPAWFAAWLNGQTWPQNGENDVLEWLSSGGGHIATSNYHGGSSPTDGTDHAQNSGQIPGTWTGRHRYGVARLPDGGGTSMRIWDGTTVKTFTVHDGGAVQYMILSIGDTNSGGAGPVIVRRATAWSFKA